MKAVTVVISSYNGEKYIIKQLESIFKQIGVRIQVFIRDDGSTDNTINLLKDFSKKHKDLTIIEGENVGWEQSFMLALKEAPQADYYAFSDQDDIWFENKLINGIEKMDALKDKDIPVMYHCNKLSVDENLKPLRHQVRRTHKPLNRKNAIVQEYAQGCSIIINENAKELVTKHLPKNKIPHDFWCGLLCYLFGEVLYDNNPFFYHILHGKNTSGEGNMINSWKKRMEKFHNNSSIYYAPATDILKGYNNLLTDKDKIFILKIIKYKYSLSAKLSLILSLQFIRDSIIGTISLKLAILLNKL